MMKYWMALVMLFHGAASAQTIFFDDFQGNELLPHWEKPLPQDWEYNVSRGMLNVTGLFYPSHPHHPTNFAAMATFFAPQADLQIDARMGWGGSTTVARLDLVVRINSGLIANIGYRGWTTPPSIVAATGAGLVAIAAPPPGMYDFRVMRRGSQFEFFFDGVRFATLQDTYGGPLNGFSLDFSGPYPGTVGPFHVDQVRVIPSPAPFSVAVVAAAYPCARRRRTR